MLSPEVKVEAGLHSLPIQFHKHPLRDTVQYYAARNPEAGFSEDLLMINPEDRVALYRAKVDAAVTKEGHRTRFTIDGRAWGGGACKSSSAMAYLRPSNEVRCRINHQTPYDYFPETPYRAQAIAPLFIAGMEDDYEVRLYVRGGGRRAKAQACANALARAIIKLKPEMKSTLRHLGMITLDRRRKEAKHINRYKARKKYPYVRR
jgi:small subunit ribosomal protein S9